MNGGQPSSPGMERSTAAAFNWVVWKGDTLGETQSNTTRLRRGLRAEPLSTQQESAASSRHKMLLLLSMDIEAEKSEKTFYGV